MKVLVGMSGGVDSSVAAGLLREAGHEVEGLSLLLFESGGRASTASCCSRLALEDAAKTAALLGIAHRVIDARPAFIEHVIEPFVEAYCSGLTPNPCIMCNRRVKFPILLGEALKGGAEAIATGHYARVERGGGGEGVQPVVRLMMGVDPSKDQSYVLFALKREELRHLQLPLGGWMKADVRDKARSLGLPVFDRPESQEICFVRDGNYSGFIENLSPLSCTPGPIVDQRGKVVGRHQGVCHYTIGQRKGLGISSPSPHYVTAIDAAANTVRVGPREAAMGREFTVSGLNWLVEEGVVRGGSFKADVKVRSAMPARGAEVFPLGGERLKVVFEEPQWAPAPGQAAVFYDGDTVLGGGTIEKALTQAI